MEGKLISFSDFKKYKDYIISIRRKKKLHSITEKNLEILLKDLYSESYAISEINVNGGRLDLIILSFITKTFTGLSFFSTRQ